jgi:hypothetical protein
MDRELTKVIEDFMRAVDVETLRLARRTGTHSSSWSRDSSCLAASSRARESLLLRRLKPVETSYHRDHCCMDGTRQSLLNQVIAWVTKEHDQSSTYWVYGLPGIGKTSLAHSVCASLHKGQHLAGAFFCRRDDPNLSEPRNILPTLIYKLSIIFPLFRTVVAESLRNDPNLTPESMKYTFFHDLICKLPRPPARTLVLVIDAFDESGDNRSRPGVLKVLADAAAQAPWLKIIITSRPETDIERFFNSLTPSSYLRYDLAADENATSDLRVFAQDRFSRVASERYLRSPWPEQSLFNGIISRAAGLFIFIETISLALEQCDDPTELLKATLEDSAGTSLKSLYKLYSSILKARIVHNNAKFQRVIGVLLATAPYRPLCEETIGELAGVDLRHVKTWVDNLSSLLYRDERANGAIRVRHLSISDFFVSNDCPSNYRVDLGDTNVQLGIVCLKTMVRQLRFNICKLEDSRLANTDVRDLESRIRDNISDALQYSSLYWSNHLCFLPDNRDRHVMKEFVEGLYPLFWIEVLSIMGMVRLVLQVFEERYPGSR